ncbi:aldehyde dehydrogenase family protein [Maricurvus nonylphenolicus]|uniref:aldehyde dehydrogenase family protein n=1 Tax=Maricurvus nonylphenolicus TaxID=1008307 RepID=UPI0036F2185A
MREFKALINGELLPGEGTFDVINPANEEVVGGAPENTLYDLDAAVSAASNAFPAWSSISVQDRSEYLQKIKDIIEENCDELAELVTLEQGKPLVEARNEVERSALLASVMPFLQLPQDTYLDDQTNHAYAEYSPLGVVAAIPPWNYPILSAIVKIVSAIYVGNTVVVKPSPLTPMSILKFGELIKDVLPKGVINIITSSHDELGRLMTMHTGVDAVSFTGSSTVGKKIMESSGARLKRIILELGGNDAAVVLEDVDPQKVAKDLIKNAFYNSGQVCIGIKRLYVHESKFESMKQALVAELKKLVVGDGSTPETTMGPLQNQSQVDSMHRFLNDAVAGGAEVLFQSDIPEGAGFFFPPTLLTNLAEDSKILVDEAFGPFLPIIPFKDVDEVIKKANQGVYGLAGSVWTSDIEKGKSLAKSLRTGTVWINQHRALHPFVPFGGVKESGIGCEMGVDGLLQYTERRVVNILKEVDLS